jgi:hypothetical protein
VNIASQSDVFVDIVNASVSLSHDTTSEVAVTIHTECFRDPVKQHMKKCIISTILVLAPLLSGICLAESHEHLPLITSTDDDSRDYWLPKRVNIASRSKDLVGLVNALISPETRNVLAKQPKINISLIYPETVLSGFWDRHLFALSYRLYDLAPSYQIKVFTSRQIGRSLQAQYVQQIINRKKGFDFVIYGLSDLPIQKDNIEVLIEQADVESFIWSFHTPFKSLSVKPLICYGFSDIVDAELFAST